MRGESSQQPRRGNRPSLSPEEKLEACSRVSGGESKASVARELGVPESTLRGWCKNTGKIAKLIGNARRSSQSPDSSPYSPESTGSGASNRGAVSDDDEVVPSNHHHHHQQQQQQQHHHHQQHHNHHPIKKRKIDHHQQSVNIMEASGEQKSSSSDISAAATAASTKAAVAAVAAAAAAAVSQPVAGYDLASYTKAIQNSLSSLTEEQRNFILNANLINANYSYYQKLLGMSPLQPASSPVSLNSNGNGPSASLSSSSATVNFVDNGLQYHKNIGNGGVYLNGGGGVSSVSKVSSKNNNNNNSSSSSSSNSGRRSSSHTSVVAPTTSLLESGTNSVARQSMSPAAEPPSTLIPTHSGGDYYNNLAQLANGSNTSNRKRRGATSPSRKPSFVFNNSTAEAWKDYAQKVIDDPKVGNKNFFYYYKLLGLPLSAQQQRLIDSVNETASSTSTTTDAATNLCTRLSLGSRAALDSIMCNNNNNNNNNNNKNKNNNINANNENDDDSDSNSSSSRSSEKHCQENAANQEISTGLNGSAECESKKDGDSNEKVKKEMSIDDALNAGEQLLDWITDNQVFNLTHLEVLQFRGLLKKIKSSKERTNGTLGLKHSRK